MPSLIIEGAAPWDGHYEFDFEFTNRELHEIKLLSGVRAGELVEALDANDRAAYVGVGLVVLKRHGKLADPDDLWNAKVGTESTIRIDLDADPPTQQSGNGSEPSEKESSSGSVSESVGG